MISVKLNKELASSSGRMVLDVDFQIEHDSIVAVTGVSGSGKTTLLRCLAGLTEPDSGYISSGSETWFDSAGKKKIHARKRNTGFVFQDYALFPNMTFRENIIYACGDAGRADEFIRISGLEGVSRLYPDKLSSGQKQRCALLRAVVRGPELLLLDEPFSALDGETKKLFHTELLRWKKMFGLTVVIVSHDRSEVVKLTERVICLNNGKIESDISHRRGCPGTMSAIQAAARRVS